MTAARPTTRRTWLALGGAVAAHLVFGLFWSWDRDYPILERVSTAAGQPAEPPDGSALAQVALLDAPVDPLRPIAGAEDRAPTGAGHPLPAADVDSPGDSAAARAGGAIAGAESISDQHYRRATTEQPWSDPDLTQQQRLRNATRARSEEAILRAPERGIDQRTAPARPLAEDGAERGRPGQDRGTAQPIDGAPGVDWSRMDPRYQQGAGARVAQRSPGAVQPEPTDGFVLERGATSADALRDGRAGDTRTVAAASAERDPLPADLITPRSGGDTGDGFRGRERVGHSAQGEGRGSAATTAEIATGAGTAMWARRDDPYFRRFHDRLDREVRFPRQLAIRLEQGQLVARFVLRADGTLADIELTKPSGFAEFDRELVRALRALSPLGPVPRSFLGRRDRVAVLLDYEFKNPVIR